MQSLGQDNGARMPVTSFFATKPVKPSTAERITSRVSKRLFAPLECPATIFGAIQDSANHWFIL